MFFCFFGVAFLRGAWRFRMQEFQIEINAKRNHGSLPLRLKRKTDIIYMKGLICAFWMGGGAMKYTTLGNSGIRGSRICLGGLSFGRITPGGHQWLLDEEQCADMIRHAFDLGINFIDTANKYADGTSEE